MHPTSKKLRHSQKWLMDFIIMKLVGGKKRAFVQKFGWKSSKCLDREFFKLLFPEKSYVFLLFFEPYSFPIWRKWSMLTSKASYIFILLQSDILLMIRVSLNFWCIFFGPNFSFPMLFEATIQDLSNNTQIIWIRWVIKMI